MPPRELSRLGRATMQGTVRPLGFFEQVREGRGSSRSRLAHSGPEGGLDSSERGEVVLVFRLRNRAATGMSKRTGRRETHLGGGTS